MDVCCALIVATYKGRIFQHFRVPRACFFRKKFEASIIPSLALPTHFTQYRSIAISNNTTIAYCHSNVNYHSHNSHSYPDVQQKSTTHHEDNNNVTKRTLHFSL